MAETLVKDIVEIRSLSQEQLRDWFANQGEPAFRSKQVWEWIWKRSASSFLEMTNLPTGLREKMHASFAFDPIKIHKKQISTDGTIKFVFRLRDGKLIEGVLIPAEDRMTACISSQVGCSLTCKFCATGYMDRERNLEPYELYDQVVLIARAAMDSYKQPLSNIVLMGMGEPLLNYKNVLDGIGHITGADGLNMSSKRITLSTAGIAKMIAKLGDDEVKFNLALSLHAANDEKRNTIMPINEQNSLQALAGALQHFYRKTGNRITFEYIVFDGFNDELEDAKELEEFCKKVPSKVNIIEYNPISEAKFKNAGADKIDRFAQYLRSRDIVVNVRRSRGKDIDAACGQLAVKQKLA